MTYFALKWSKHLKKTSLQLDLDLPGSPTISGHAVNGIHHWTLAELPGKRMLPAAIANQQYS